MFPKNHSLSAKDDVFEPMEPMKQEHANEEPSWFEKKSSLRIMVGSLVVCCVLLLLAQLTYENDHALSPSTKTCSAFRLCLGSWHSW